MIAREKKLLRIVMSAMMQGNWPRPTFDEWIAAFDELYS
jgi:hypothetical protein